jgi:hypothetical protein
MDRRSAAALLKGFSGMQPFDGNTVCTLWLWTPTMQIGSGKATSKEWEAFLDDFQRMLENSRCPPRSKPNSALGATANS